MTRSMLSAVQPAIYLPCGGDLVLALTYIDDGTRKMRMRSPARKVLGLGIFKSPNGHSPESAAGRG